MKVAVISDVHANLPALEAVLGALKDEACDQVFHLGDAIAIGPFPAECLDLLLGFRAMRFVMGNHDAYFARGLPEPQPAWMSDGEAAHQRWTHRQIDPALRAVVAAWPMRLLLDTGREHLAFQHYALDASGSDFAGIMRSPAAAELDRAFGIDGGIAPSVVFYGHSHEASDIQGRARYVNPGALGCDPAPVARYVIATCRWGGVHIEHRQVSYDDVRLFAAFDARQVPESSFIRGSFFGGR